MTTLIRPGFLVSVKTKTHDRGTTYTKEVIVPGEEYAKWTTTRVSKDPEEHKRCTKAANAARYLIASIGANSAFGILCPKSKEAELDAAIAEAKRVIREHNATAKYATGSLYVIKASIAETDEQAAASIASELRDLLAAVNDGIDALDPEKIRDAASKAKEISAMLSPEAEERVGEAVKAARQAAREITRRVEKKGESAAQVLVEIDRRAINEARIAFLDMSEDAETETIEALPSVAVQRFADIGDDDPEPVRDIVQDAIDRDALEA